MASTRRSANRLKSLRRCKYDVSHLLYEEADHDRLATLFSAQSTQLNKSRLRLLQRREEHLDELFEKAREELLALSKDEGRYAQLIEGIVLQVRPRHTPYRSF